MTDLTTITDTPVLTMSTREIADLCEKRHDNVLRDTEKALDALEVNRLKFEGVYSDAKGEERKCYNLPKDLSLTLVAGYNIKLRKKIIDRWLELEAGQYSIPQTRAEALRLAADLEEENQTLKVELKEAQPKTKFYDKFANAGGLYGLQNAARCLGLGPRKFTQGLKEEGFLFHQGGALIPYAKHRKKGLFEVKCTIVDETARYRTWIAPKGLQFFAKKYEAVAQA